MHWIIDRLIADEFGSDNLVAALDRAGSAYTLVKKPPFADYIVGIDSSDAPLDLLIDGPVFVSGSTAMKAISQARGWLPGYIDAPGVDECLAHWRGHMLNSDLYTGPIGSISPPDVPFFIRPLEDGKAFAGAVIDPADFDGWRDQLLAVDGYTALAPDTPVAIARVKNLLREYRCLIVDGRLITGSRYKVGLRVDHHPDLPGHIASFVQRRADEWSPRCAFIVDIAETDLGMRIVETNSVSSAGFYAMDMARYVEAINQLVSDPGR